MIADRKTAMPWYRPVLVLAGLAALARGVIALYQPDYWSPRTPLDYAAVIGTSVTFLLVAVGLWGFRLHQPKADGPAGAIWRGAILTACAAALAMSLSNFLEDALFIRWLDQVWVVGMVLLPVSLLAAGGSALRVKGLARAVGGLLLMSAAGLLLMETYGLFLFGLAMIFLAIGRPRG